MSTTESATVKALHEIGSPETCQGCFKLAYLAWIGDDEIAAFEPNEPGPWCLSVDTAGELQAVHLTYLQQRGAREHGRPLYARHDCGWSHP